MACKKQVQKRNKSKERHYKAEMMAVFFPATASAYLIPHQIPWPSP